MQQKSKDIYLPYQNTYKLKPDTTISRYSICQWVEMHRLNINSNFIVVMNIVFIAYTVKRILHVENCLYEAFFE